MYRPVWHRSPVRVRGRDRSVHRRPCASRGGRTEGGAGPASTGDTGRSTAYPTVTEEPVPPASDRRTGSRRGQGPGLRVHGGLPGRPRAAGTGAGGAEPPLRRDGDPHSSVRPGTARPASVRRPLGAAPAGGRRTDGTAGPPPAAPGTPGP